jgi:hypothetical protein
MRKRIQIKVPKNKQSENNPEIVKRVYPKRTPCKIVDFAFNNLKEYQMRPVHQKVPFLLGGTGVEEVAETTEKQKRGKSVEKLPKTFCNFFKVTSKDLKQIYQANPRKKSEEKTAYSRPKEDERDLWRFYKGGFKVNPKGKKDSKIQAAKNDKDSSKPAKASKEFKDMKQNTRKGALTRSVSESRLRERSRHEEKKINPRRNRA